MKGPEARDQTKLKVLEHRACDKGPNAQDPKKSKMLKPRTYNLERSCSPGPVISKGLEPQNLQISYPAAKDL